VPPIAGPTLALVLAMAFFSLKSDRFLHGQNLSLVLQQVAVVGTMAIGQTLVILTAGIDLSCATVMALGQIVMTKLALANGVPVVPALLLGMLTCVGFGALNGGLVTGVRLPPFIVTLGTLNIAYALTHIVSNDNTFYGLRQTAWGRHVYAVGDNREAARLTGIKTERVLLGVYVVAGLMYGIAALLLVGRTEIGDPNAGQTTENLDVITAVVLGGTSLFGGRGTVIGTLIGAVIVGVFRNGLTLIGVEVIYQYLVTGILVILAVSIDQLAHRRRL
jgi:fructose transport system permease protein